MLVVKKKVPFTTILIALVIAAIFRIYSVSIMSHSIKHNVILI